MPVHQVYHAQGRFSEALSVFEEALKIRRARLGAAHPNVAATLSNIAVVSSACRGCSAWVVDGRAQVYEKQERLAEAAQTHEEALEIRTTKLGTAHPDVATSLNNLAMVILVLACMVFR